MDLQILFQDQDYVVINKPAGLLVHRTKIDYHETQSALQLLRYQINAPVFPVHRLDRPTSGVLLFALSSEAAQQMALEFSEQRVHKKYFALVRGKFSESVRVKHPLLKFDESLKSMKGKHQELLYQSAETLFRPLKTVEVPIAIDKYPTSRFSLVEACPVTGRRHQIRRHLKHLNHPIIGDVNFGNGKYNKYFSDTFGAKRLMLTSVELSFTHPKTQQYHRISAPLDENFKMVLQKLELIA